MQSWPAPHVPALPGRSPQLRIFDTASRTLVDAGPGAPVPPGEPGVSTSPAEPARPATMYVCGITPYDATHLGHAATYVTFDLLMRAWRDGGHDVRYCQNVTDVDDPLLERAQRDGQDWTELASREIELFRDDMVALRVVPPTWYVGAVEAVPEIVEAIVWLRNAGLAYDLDGDVYFPVSAAPHFGTVANLDLPAMRALAAERGGDPDRPGKKHPLDVLLWQAGRPGEPSWPSPMGHGRPGWHIECTAIALPRLGPTIDVQGGGSDLAYPHHELGAAHAAALTGNWPFARAYVHTGMVALHGEKMSKSRGNLVFVSALRRDRVDPAAIRLALLAHHYRTDWEWIPADLSGAQQRLALWRAAVGRPAGPPAGELLDAVRMRLADDLHADEALQLIDRWASSAATGDAGASRVAGGNDPTAPDVVRSLADALLGVQL
ncbi:MAG: cysteine--1-D-myo-inosityl 2-amino-2-deoxy-alpha-D-glucopyranoside ligase [Actinomycetota bacterium]|nr:cysteine--1-D-myo-inosityl 2-amino-2-deoxy-alpha-D-glucopyranoside ligase [Actinomycetota bacterium]